MIFLSMLCLLNIFFFLDIFLVFFFFELILIPMFFFIGIWGSRQRKVYAAYLLFIYTLIGSIFALIAFIYFYLNLGSSNFFFFLLKFIENEIQFLFFFFLLLGFSVKVPMIPVHI
jgi:NADH:ubiquinone oxidoreductase subunit 4 (subunit M)